MQYQLTVIECPNGLFTFVGSVPYNLGYTTKAGNAVTAEEVESQLRLPASYRTIKNRTFSSRDEAWREASRLGWMAP